MNDIDAHVHIWTKDVEHYPLAAGRAPNAVDPDFTAGKLLGICRPLGVSRVVLIQPGEYGTDNAYMLDMIKLHPDVFVGVAVIDMNRAVAATMRELKTRGVSGFRIVGHKTRPDIAHWLDGATYHELFATAAETGQSVCCLIDPEAIPALDKMCAKYPATSVVVDHMARIGADGQVRDRDVGLLCDLARRGTVRVKVSAFYALGQKKPPYTDLVGMIRRLYGAYGSRRLMWASDSPYQVQDGHTYGDSLALVRDRCDFFSADDRDWLLRRTAEAVFFEPLTADSRALRRGGGQK